MTEPVLDRLTPLFEADRDPERAAGMRAYMRDQFEFLGIASPRQRALARQATAGAAKPTRDGLIALADACWARPEREYQYFACDYLRRHVAVLGGLDALPAVRRLITTKPWWDTVDLLAARVVGPMVSQHGGVMDAWIDDDNLWVVRTALLHQLFYKRDTDADRLFDYCARQKGHTDFFVRKAIGWALREYAKTDPAAVRAFVAATDLSGLSRREALKNL
ncbi:3-methyladenine DNA glycosylase AlkD [Asanoa hainanensis]|uniref:3-methyladenine DNA glycosylase AlkD n=1 Tax=Asanoa hainanensis TaxID=560556 RepID=A0A239P832_9ACTN|nr:DNA alkylation repair protein [Asanoa hainanensis]SNT62559.1 3-methyladenine DNA glycosylase AlkD [Asanoa hainanensis]